MFEDGLCVPLTA